MKKGNVSCSITLFLLKRRRMCRWGKEGTCDMVWGVYPCADMREKGVFTLSPSEAFEASSRSCLADRNRQEYRAGHIIARIRPCSGLNKTLGHPASLHGWLLHGSCHNSRLCREGFSAWPFCNITKCPGKLSLGSRSDKQPLGPGPGPPSSCKGGGENQGLEFCTFYVEQEGASVSHWDA